MTPATLLDQLRERLPLIVVAAVSTAWIVIVVLYLARLGIAAMMELSVTDFSVLLAATGAPLVGLWLVVAVVTQRGQLADLRRRLTDMTNQSRQSLQQAEVLSRAVLEMETQLKRNLSSETRRLALQDLASQAAGLAERLGILKGEAIDIAWARFGSGDVGAFVQPFLAYLQQHPDLAARIADASARDAATHSAVVGIVESYERLASALADDKLAERVLDEGPMGRGYRLLKSAATMSRGQGTDAVAD
ncbi:MAG: hypothetical protein SFV19_02135 [Rhodospirillaceae bacterium]|nr:hypothetical protein [Rhodospirillaceae bacterium]